MLSGAPPLGGLAGLRGSARLASLSIVLLGCAPAPPAKPTTRAPTDDLLVASTDPWPPRPAPGPSATVRPSVIAAPSAPGRRSRFRGRRIDLDLRAADVHNAVRLLADAADANIVVAGDVGGDVTLRLRNVPWDQALDAIVRVKKLRLERRGDILFITKP